MNQIQKLVSQGNLSDAIDLIEGNSGIMLASRFNELERKNRMGVISEAEYRVQRNKIVESILAQSGDSDYYSLPQPTMQHTHIPSNLQTIISENRRRRPEIAEQAQSILNDYRAYSDSKSVNPAFDPAGRRYKAIQEAEAALIESLKNERDNSLEQTVSRIQEYLIEAVPSYDNLNEAYKLAAGRGMQDQWIEDQLQARPEDRETKIDIAEKIEMFISRISVK